MDSYLFYVATQSNSSSNPYACEHKKAEDELIERNLVYDYCKFLNDKHFELTSK